MSQENEMPMPAELQRAVANLSGDFRTTAIENWDAIGEDGRDAYLRYLDRAWTKRARQKRSELAAWQLLHPEVGDISGYSGGTGGIGW